MLYAFNDDDDASVRSMRADKRNNIHPNLINPFYVEYVN